MIRKGQWNITYILLIDAKTVDGLTNNGMERI